MSSLTLLSLTLLSRELRRRLEVADPLRVVVLAEAAGRLVAVHGGRPTIVRVNGCGRTRSRRTIRGRIESEQALPPSTAPLRRVRFQPHHAIDETWPRQGPRPGGSGRRRGPRAEHVLIGRSGLWVGQAGDNAFVYPPFVQDHVQERAARSITVAGRPKLAIVVGPIQRHPNHALAHRVRQPRIPNDSFECPGCH